MTRVFNSSTWTGLKGPYSKIFNGSGGIFTGFTSANTVNAKKAINDVINGIGSRHIAVCGNSTKAGWGSNGSAFGTPGSLLSASIKSQGQVAQWASLLSAQYAITVSSDNFWGDSGWNTPTSNVTSFDARLAASATATLSGTILGPGGRALTTTNATDTWSFTPGSSFDKCSIFHAGIGTVFNVTGDVEGVAHPSLAGSGNTALRLDITFPGLQNTITFQSTGAAGFRIYGGFTERSGVNKLHVHNMGWGNSTSANWSSTSVGSAPRDAINLLAPQLVLFSEGINDPNTGVATNTHNTNIQTFLNNVKNSNTDAIIYDDHWTASSDVDGAGGHGTLAAITAALQGNKASASSLGIPYVDSPTYFTSYANQKNNLNFMYDVSHMLGAGQTSQANNLLMPMTLAFMAA